jgi:hypothetical protein
VLPAVRLGGTCLVAVACAAVVLPSGLDLWERATGWLVEYEFALRGHLALAAGLALAGSAIFRWQRWSEPSRTAWRSLALAYAAALSVFVGDAGWLWREEAWIRYPTAVFLIAAGVYAARAALRPRGPVPGAAGERGGWADVAAWLLFAAAFVALGADELLSVHERLGRWLARRAPVAFHQDAMTWLYAIGGALFLAALFLSRVRRGPTRHAWLMRGYAIAIAVFGAGQLCDALDERALAVLEAAGRALADDGHRFPEVWHPFEWPRRWLNSTEELTELGAAGLLLAWTRRAAIPLRVPASRNAIPAGAARRTTIARVAFVASVAALVVLGWRSAWSPFPFSAARPLAAAHALDDPAADPGVRLDPDTASVIVSVDGRPAAGLRLRRILRMAEEASWTPEGTLRVVVPAAEESFVPALTFDVERARALELARGR